LFARPGFLPGLSHFEYPFLPPLVRRLPMSKKSILMLVGDYVKLTKSWFPFSTSAEHVGQTVFPRGLPWEKNRASHVPTRIPDFRRRSDQTLLPEKAAP